MPLHEGALVVNEGVPGDLSVIPGSPADKTGIKEFDIITHCNKEKITEDRTLEDIMRDREVGEEITLTVYREGTLFDKKITLKEFQKI